MKYLKHFESYNNDTINSILDKINKSGLSSLTNTEMNYLKVGDDSISDDIDMSFDEWKLFYKPISIKDFNPEIYWWDACVIQNDESNFEKVMFSSPYKVWTMLNGSGSKIEMVNGFYRFDNLGYVITEIEWKQGQSFNISV
jgi:hypothetical protein